MSFLKDNAGVIITVIFLLLGLGLVVYRIVAA